MSVYGGKITTSRMLAEHTMQKLGKYYDYKAGDWTETALLPGGDLIDADFELFVSDMRKRYPDLDEDLLRRLCHGYGTRITLILGDGTSAPKLGQHFGAGLYELEANYLNVCRNAPRLRRMGLGTRQRLYLSLRAGHMVLLDSPRHASPQII